MTNPQQNQHPRGKRIRSLLQNIDSDLKNASGNLKQGVAENVLSVLRIPVELIEPNPRQPRHDFDEQALQELDEKHRSVFLLRDVQGLSVKETADALGLTEANVKVRLLRARLKLRERLTRALGDEAKRLQPDHRHE